MYGINAPDFEVEQNLKSWFVSLFRWIGSRIGVTNQTANYTVLENVYWVRADVSAGAASIILPLSAGRTGRQIGIIKVDASANQVTVSPSSGDSVGFTSVQSLASLSSRMVVIADGTTNWDIVLKQ